MVTARPQLRPLFDIFQAHAVIKLYDINLFSLRCSYIYLFCLTVNIFSDAEFTYNELVTGTGGKLKTVTEAVYRIFCALYCIFLSKLCTGTC